MIKMLPNFFLSVLISHLIVGCSANDIAEIVNGKRKAPEIVDFVEANSSGLTGIRAQVIVTNRGVKIEVHNAPNAAQLVCIIDDQKPAACKNGDVFQLPVAGDHVLTVNAISDGNVIDSAVVKFTVGADLRDTEIYGSDDKQHSLALAIKNPDFENGKPISVSTGFTVEFEFINTPPCTSPVLRCAMDSQSSMWSLCSSNGMKRNIYPTLMARGSQIMYARASCDDFTGPALPVQWYGVPEDYLPLMIDLEHVATDKAVVALIREPDCPGNRITFQCSRNPLTEPWASCAPSGVLFTSELRSYSFVRGICGDQVGPSLSL